MKILVFEYICGGGFAATKLPPALAQEGLLMLTALTQDLLENHQHQLTILMDWRLTFPFNNHLKCITIQPETVLLEAVKKAILNVDAVWLIAPETENILLTFTQLVQLSNKILLSSPSCAVKETADKWHTFQRLSFYNITTVNSILLHKKTTVFAKKTVLKKRDGVGSTACFIINSQQELEQHRCQINKLDDYILQPFIEGKNLSLSALFKAGKAQLLCVNQQKIRTTTEGFKLYACKVNNQVGSFQFQLLLDKIATAFPTLWGYVGIDLIQYAQKLYVLEVNPRLTTSYAGIRQALGINIADEVLRLTKFELRPPPMTANQTITIAL